MGPSSVTDDHQLMRRLANGDDAAFTALYRRHRRFVFRQALEITRVPAAAEEVTQDAFLSLWSGAARFDPDRASLSAWLSRVVRNRSIDALRRAARHSCVTSLDDSLAEALPSRQRLEEDVVQASAGGEVRKLICDLPAGQRQVIFLSYYAELTQQEIAARISRPVGTVKSRQRLALAKLGNRLEPELTAA